MAFVFKSLFNQGQSDPSVPKCPRCGHELASSEINVTADTALCAACESALRYSDIVGSSGFMGMDPAKPPKGASFQPAAGGFTVQANTRSFEALFLIPFMCLWSGFSLTGIYGTQIRKGVFDLSSSLFGLPFLLGTFAMGGHVHAAPSLYSACVENTLTSAVYTVRTVFRANVRNQVTSLTR